MTRMYGINLQGIDDYVPDGTGIDQAKLATFLNGPARVWGRTLTIGVCVYQDIDPLVYRPIYRKIRAMGHKTFARVCDSYAMKNYSVPRFERLYREHLNVNAPDIDYVEIANEVSGSRGDLKWPGPQAHDKLLAASRVCLNSNKPRVVTLFFNNDDPGYVWEWCKAHPFPAEIVLMSDYPRSTPDYPMCALQGIITQLGIYFPKACIGFGEYGCENPKGKDDASPEARLQMLRDFELRELRHPRDIGANFFWDGYKYLLSDPNNAIIALYEGAFQ